MPATLKSEIAHYVGKGFQVRGQDAESAALVKPKRFSLLWFFAGFGIFYLPWYVAKRDESIYIWQDEQGLHSRGGKWTLGSMVRKRMVGYK